MANFFDQFDEQPPGTPGQNFFDQFDAQPAPAAPEPSSWAGDVAKSFGSGVVRGTAETAMLPVTAKRLADSGATWLFDQGEDLVRSVFGIDDPSAETLAARDQARGVIGDMDAPVYAAQDAVRGSMDLTLHKPETRAGKFAGGARRPTEQGGPNGSNGGARDRALCRRRARQRRRPGRSVRGGRSVDGRHCGRTLRSDCGRAIWKRRDCRCSRL